MRHTIATNVLPMMVNAIPTLSYCFIVTLPTIFLNKNIDWLIDVTNIYWEHNCDIHCSRHQDISTRKHKTKPCLIGADIPESWKKSMYHDQSHTVNSRVIFQPSHFSLCTILSSIQLCFSYSWYGERMWTFEMWQILANIIIFLVS